MVQVPLLGRIAAGQPIEAIQDKETIAIPQSKLPLPASNYYALRVVGDSMVDENINNGDIVLVKEQATAENGQKVVALIDNQEATLKKYYKERGHIRLQPANKAFEPIIVRGNRDFAIQGVVLDVIKSNFLEETRETKIIPRGRTQEPDYWNHWVNTIQNLDCIIGMQSLPDNSVDLIITDPPYGISKELNCKGKRLGSTAKLDFNFGVWDKLDQEWFGVALQKTRGWMITFCAKRNVGFFIEELEQKGFIAVDVLVWQKPDPVPLNAKSRFLNAWEAIVVGKKPGSVWNSTYEHNIIKVQAPKGKSRVHPTQKPVALIKKLIELTTNERALVLDPFMGSGTTAIAAIESKRNYIGFELSREYWKQSLERIAQVSHTLWDASVYTNSAFAVRKSEPVKDT
jgi:DNA modification methylase